MSDKCPKCGAISVYPEGLRDTGLQSFSCGSHNLSREPHQSDVCRITELETDHAKLSAERDKAVSLIRDLIEYNSLSPFLQSTTFDKMKELLRDVDKKPWLYTEIQRSQSEPKMNS